MVSLFSKKVAVVTGASSGIGEAIALMFASRGAKVTLCGRDQERLKSVFDKAVDVSGGYQDNYLTFEGDLNDSRVRKEAIDRTVEKFGRLDILVANAATLLPQQSVMVATEETYDLIMDTNLKSVFFLIQEAVPHLEKSKGNIVNISSILTSFTSPDMPIYSASKTGIDHVTKCLAVDLGPKGIRVNVVNCGFVSTRMLRHFGCELEAINELAAKTEYSVNVLKRMTTKEDVAGVVEFLASDSAASITGESIHVDCGRRFKGNVY